MAGQFSCTAKQARLSKEAILGSRAFFFGCVACADARQIAAEEGGHHVNAGVTGMVQARKPKSRLERFQQREARAEPATLRAICAAVQFPCLPNTSSPSTGHVVLSLRAMVVDPSPS